MISLHVRADDHEIAAQRAKFLSFWTKRAMALDAEETALKCNMDTVVARAVANKRILVVKEPLEATKFPDPSVIDELQQGSQLIGEVPTTCMLPGKFPPALSTPEEVHDNAKRMRLLMNAEAAGSGDDDIDRIVWEKIMEEVEKGWLAGPLQEHEVPVQSPISRRFGLKQKKGKVRRIDDFPESGVNGCVTAVESRITHD